MKAQTRSEIADLLAKHGLSPIHRLGQHFLADANITRKIVELAGVVPGSKVVEIGAGTGTLTAALAAAGAEVTSYEIDTGLRPLLEEVLEGTAVELRFEDASKIDLSDSLRGDGWSLIANLPYNVGTPIVLEAMQSAPAVDRFVVMVQREVARRFAASVGSPDYGLPSVIAGIHTDARVAFEVPPQVFYPPPNVGSAVAMMTRKPAPEEATRAISLARAGFGQRRKMLRRSLDSMLEDPSALLESKGFDPTARAEELSPEQWLELAS